MANSIKHIISQFNLQTRLFNNVTTGVSDDHSHEHLNEIVCMKSALIKRFP